ncbi:DmsC/YnfH family molybdoenzyme membrane anchor subunit, partial [Trueperella pyogenes]
TTPIVYLIGPALVFGLIASMFHMNDITHTLNVIRNIATSWLSREIIFGVGFAGLGFIFAFLQWFKIGPFRLRQAVAFLAGIFGIGLIISMSMIYSTLPTVPAWNTWIIPFHFFMTAIILGAAAVTTSLVLMTLIRQKSTTTGHDSTQPNTNKTWLDTLGFTTNARAINAAPTKEEWHWTISIIRLCTTLSTLAAVAVLISYTAHLQNLATHPEPAATISATVFTGGFFWTRLIL